MTQSELAAQIAVSPAVLSRIEAGLTPKDDVLDALCDVLLMQRGFFFVPIHDEFKREQCSFRHRQAVSKKVLDTHTARGTLIQDFIRVLEESAVLPPVNVPDIHARSEFELESAAEECRKRWRLGLGPILDMMRVAESRAGVLVVELRATTEMVDAFSRFGSPPVIVLSSVRHDPTYARFSVGHELGHLVAHRNTPTGDKDTEREADAFSSAFLMPKDSFFADFRALPLHNWQGFFELKRRWGVPVKAVVYRAHWLGLITTARYRQHMKHYAWKGWHRGEPFEPEPEQAELFKAALEEFERDGGNVLSAIQHLYWTRDRAQKVLPFDLPSDAPPLPDNVTQLKRGPKQRPPGGGL